MSQLLKPLSSMIYNQFKLFWLLLSSIALSISLYINWQVNIYNANKALADIATTVSNNVDGFIEDLFQEVYTLPVYGKNFADCKSVLYPYLERIILNNPKISGLTISDTNHELICSTSPNGEDFISTTVHARTILGPFQIPMFDQPVYVLQQRMGNYHIGILIVASELERVLKTSPQGASSIALHNTFESKNIIRIEYNTDHNHWIYSPDQQLQSPVDSEDLFAMDKLQSIEGITVVIFENHEALLHSLWYHQILNGLLVMLTSGVFYFLIKNIVTRRYSLHGALKLALKNEEFYPEYQPLYDRETDAFSGAEVLLRWQNDQNTIIMPDFFIGEAETTGLIVPITLQIIEIAFRESNELLINNPNFHLSFNISALHFIDSEFFNAFHQLIKDYHISPQQIILEITERDLLDKNNQIFINRMNKLRQAGFSLAVDDYGTGHASISYLQHFPFNYLKIDKIFIHAIGTKAITESLNDAIINMAKGLNLVIIAEGVETEDQVNYLSNNGVRYLQGWYFSKALSIEKLMTIVNGEEK